MGDNRQGDYMSDNRLVNGEMNRQHEWCIPNMLLIRGYTPVISVSIPVSGPVSS